MIKFSEVYFKYKNGPVVMKDFTVEFPPGIITILGPNGSGKTTLLKLAAGILSPQRGSVEIMGEPPARLRGKIAYLPQGGGLYPWMKIQDNIALPLRIRGLPPGEVDRVVKQVAESLGISHLLERYPREISGGEQQKVLVARALASGAEIWLLDEPLSMIDIDYRREAIDILKKIRKTMIIITHNVQDAIDLEGYIYIVRGPPLEIIDVYPPGRYKDANELIEKARQSFRT